MVWPSPGGREEGRKGGRQGPFPNQGSGDRCPSYSDRTEKTKFLLFVQAEFLVSRKKEGKSCVIQRVDASSPPRWGAGCKRMGMKATNPLTRNPGELQVGGPLNVSRITPAWVQSCEPAVTARASLLLCLGPHLTPGGSIKAVCCGGCRSRPMVPP